MIWDWECARESAEEVPSVGSTPWGELLGVCTVRLGLVTSLGGDEVIFEPAPHLGGFGLWPGAWMESQSLSMDQDTTVDLWGFDEQLLLPCTQGDSDCDWQLLAQLPLGALDQLIAEHWPLGGCPWPKFGRHGSIYLMETSHGDRGGMNPRPFAWFEKLEGRTSTPAPCAACPTATRMA